MRVSVSGEGAYNVRASCNGPAGPSPRGYSACFSVFRHQLLHTTPIVILPVDPPYSTCAIDLRSPGYLLFRHSIVQPNSNPLFRSKSFSHMYHEKFKSFSTSLYHDSRLLIPRPHITGPSSCNFQYKLLYPLVGACSALESRIAPSSALNFPSSSLNTLLSSFDLR
jgi:hypothetical protein